MVQQGGSDNFTIYIIIYIMIAVILTIVGFTTKKVAVYLIGLLMIIIPSTLLAIFYLSYL